MDRKDFLKKGLLGTAILATSGVAAKLIENNISELDNLKILGFNHLPPEDSKIMENNPELLPKHVLQAKLTSGVRAIKYSKFFVLFKNSIKSFQL